MTDKLEFAYFWAQGDVVSHMIAILLLLMSVASWSLIVGQLRNQLRVRRTIKLALPAFWQASNRHTAQLALMAMDGSGLFVHLAEEVEHAAQAYLQQVGGGLGGTLDAGEFLGRTLQHAITRVHTRIEQGLTFLGTVGSTAPFIGLFGTVWGIYHALTGLSGTTQAALGQVAGPVGEALIMTAAGLFVAIPAVLAYNACTRCNRLVLAELDGFAHGLHADLVSGIRLHGESSPEVKKNAGPIAVGA